MNLSVLRRPVFFPSDFKCSEMSFNSRKQIDLTRFSEVVLKAGSRWSFRSSILSVVLMLPFSSVMAQSNGKGSAERTLAVTATVVASTTMHSSGCPAQAHDRECNRLPGQRIQVHAHNEPNKQTRQINQWLQKTDIIRNECTKSTGLDFLSLCRQATELSGAGPMSTLHTVKLFQGPTKRSADSSSCTPHPPKCACCQ